jgi:hypothetical protein
MRSAPARSAMVRATFRQRCSRRPLQPSRAARLPREGRGGLVERAEEIHRRRRQPRIRLALALLLALACGGHAGGHRGAGLASRCGQQLLGCGGQHLHLQVDAVEQRARQPPLVARHGLGRAAAGAAHAAARAQPAAGAGVHGGHELEARRKPRLARRARDGDDAGFQRLAQRLERGARELGQSRRGTARRRARARSRPAAAVSRRPPAPRRWPYGAARAPGGRARSRPAPRCCPRPAPASAPRPGPLLRPAAAEARQPLRQHRLAAARRAHHQQAVLAGGGDLERALGRSLALDVAQIGSGRRGNR